MDHSSAQKGIFKALLIVTICLCYAGVFGQHPLVGTWEMVSIKGIDAEGENFSIDTSTVRETKIITPTHYMLIAQDIEGDSLVFNRSYAGTIRIEDDTYIEIPMMASVQIFDDVEAAFNWKIEGDKFIQSGTITRPDGKKIVLEALVFQKVKAHGSFPDNPAIGTWNQVSSSFMGADGKNKLLTDETLNRLYFVTPTHWMRIGYRNKKFEHAMGGVYTIKDGKTYPRVDYASFPDNTMGDMEMTKNIKGDKLYVKGISTFPDGKKYTWEDVFQKMK